MNTISDNNNLPKDNQSYNCQEDGSRVDSIVSNDDAYDNKMNDECQNVASKLSVSSSGENSDDSTDSSYRDDSDDVPSRTRTSKAKKINKHNDYSRSKRANSNSKKYVNRHFTDEEDRIIISYMQNFMGNPSADTKLVFSELSKKLQRTSKSISCRWHNHLDPCIQTHAPSAEEKEIIIQMTIKHGFKYSEVKKYLTRRTDDWIRRWYLNYCRQDPKLEQPPKEKVRKCNKKKTIDHFGLLNNSTSINKNQYAQSTPVTQKEKQVNSYQTNDKLYQSNFPNSQLKVEIHKYAFNESNTIVQDENQKYISPVHFNVDVVNTLSNGYHTEDNYLTEQISCPILESPSNITTTNEYNMNQVYIKDYALPELSSSHALYSNQDIYKQFSNSLQHLYISADDENDFSDNLIGF